MIECQPFGAAFIFFLLAIQGERDYNRTMTNRNLFHVHTYRCGHAENTPEENYIKQAIENHYQEITFTDHAPFRGNPFQDRMRYEELEGYLHTLVELRKKYEGRISVSIGLELEYVPEYDGFYKELLAREEIDLLLCGQHFFEYAKERYSFDESIQGMNRAIGTCDAICAAMETGLFAVIAHPELVTFRWLDNWNEECENLAQRIIRVSNETGVKLEKNLNDRKKCPLFYEKFWGMENRIQNSIVGYDIHHLKDWERVTEGGTYFG